MSSGRRVRRRSSVTPLPAGEDDGERLARLIETFMRLSDALLADCTSGIKPMGGSHARALRLLLKCRLASERPTQQKLGELLCIDKSNVARLCQKLETVGLVVQERDPADGRARILTLTDRGARAAKTASRTAGRRFRRLCLGIPRMLAAESGKRLSRRAAPRRHEQCGFVSSSGRVGRPRRPSPPSRAGRRMRDQDFGHPLLFLKALISFMRSLLTVRPPPGAEQTGSRAGRRWSAARSA